MNMTKDQAAFNANVAEFIAKLKQAAEEFNSNEISRQNRHRFEDEAAFEANNEKAEEMMSAFLFAFNAVRATASASGIETEDIEF